MASVRRVTPVNGGARFRDGCKIHWQCRPNPREAALGMAKSTHCRKIAAEDAAALAEADLNRGAYIGRDDQTTVAEWADTWLAAAVARGIRKGTQTHYESVARVHIVAPLGQRTTISLRREHIDEWVAERRDAGVGAPILGEAAWMLRSMFDLWQEYGRPLPYGNPVPARLVHVPPKVRGDAMTVEQVRRWRDAAPENARVMIDVEAFAGARQGEVRGLREEDITFIGRTGSEPLGVQLARIARESADRYAARNVRLRFARAVDGRGNPGPMKNARGNRSLPLPASLAAKLAEHMRRWPPSGGWIFTNARSPLSGVPWRQEAYLVMLRLAARKAGVRLPPDQCSHALRHHCVSVLRDKGFSDQAIGRWIGDSPLTVQRVYGQPMPDTEERILAALEAAYAEAPVGLRLVKSAG